MLNFIYRDDFLSLSCFQRWGNNFLSLGKYNVIKDATHVRVSLAKSVCIPCTTHSKLVIFLPL